MPKIGFYRLLTQLGAYRIFFFFFNIIQCSSELWCQSYKSLLDDVFFYSGNIHIWNSNYTWKYYWKYSWNIFSQVAIELNVMKILFSILLTAYRWGLKGVSLPCIVDCKISLQYVKFFNCLPKICFHLILPAFLTFIWILYHFKK